MTAGLLEPGVVIGGDYRIVRHLAEGGMGAVYVAEQLSTGRERALKAMKPELVTDAKSRQRFVEEARVGAKIQSAHVVEVIGAGVDEATGMPWLAMELLQGEDLDSRVHRWGPLSLEEVQRLYEQLAHALGRAHAQGVIHRDLKPENIFLASSQQVGSAPILKVLDFGIATFVASDKTAATVTTAIGSPLWIAPEQTNTGAKLRASTDVWAMGLIGFFLLTGKSYWPAANVEPFNLHALIGEIVAHPLVAASVRAAQLGAGVPAGFDAWFARCVVRDPDARFANADTAAKALMQIGQGGLGHANTAPVGVAATAPIPPDSLPGFSSVLGPQAPSPVSSTVGLGSAPGASTASGAGSAPGYARFPASAAPSGGVSPLVLAAGAIAALGLVATLAVGLAVVLSSSDESDGATVAGVANAEAHPEPSPVVVPIAEPPSPEPPLAEPSPAEPAPTPTAEPAPNPFTEPDPPARPTPAATPPRPVAEAPVQDRGAEARRCLMVGDNRCVVRVLEGHARTEREYGMLIEAYRGLGNSNRALVHMRTYVDRFPGTARARSYQQIISRSGGGGSSGRSTSRRSSPGPAPSNPF